MEHFDAISVLPEIMRRLPSAVGYHENRITIPILNAPTIIASNDSDTSGHIEEMVFRKHPQNKGRWIPERYTCNGNAISFFRLHITSPYTWLYRQELLYGPNDMRSLSIWWPWNKC